LIDYTYLPLITDGNSLTPVFSASIFMKNQSLDECCFGRLLYRI